MRKAFLSEAVGLNKFGREHCRNWIRTAHHRIMCERILSMKELGESLPSTFTTEASRALGGHPRDLYAGRDEALVVELSRGVFRRADAPQRRTLTCSPWHTVRLV